MPGRVDVRVEAGLDGRARWPAAPSQLVGAARPASSGGHRAVGRHERRQVLGHLDRRGVGVVHHRLGDEVGRAGRRARSPRSTRVGSRGGVVAGELGEDVAGGGERVPCPHCRSAAQPTRRRGNPPSHSPIPYRNHDQRSERDVRTRHRPRHHLHRGGDLAQRPRGDRFARQPGGRHPVGRAAARGRDVPDRRGGQPPRPDRAAPGGPRVQAAPRRHHADPAGRRPVLGRGADGPPAALGRRRGGPPRGRRRRRRSASPTRPTGVRTRPTCCRQAVRLSGLEEPVSFTTEPEAAAVFYAQQQRIEPGRGRRRLRPRRRHVRRGRAAQDRDRLRDPRPAGGHRAARRHRLRRGGLQPRRAGARRQAGRARRGRPGGDRGRRPGCARSASRPRRRCPPTPTRRSRCCCPT